MLGSVTVISTKSGLNFIQDNLYLLGITAISKKVWSHFFLSHHKIAWKNITILLSYSWTNMRISENWGDLHSCSYRSNSNYRKKNCSNHF